MALEDGGAWTLQANPKKYRLLDAVADGVDVNLWTIAQHADDLEVDDPICIWMSGQRAGVYALGRVAGSAYETDDLDSGDYWSDPTNAAEVRWRVPIEVTVPLWGAPIPRSELAEDPDFASSLIIRMPGGRNPFPITANEWTAILERATSPDGWRLEVEDDWDLEPGDEIKRTELHDRFGGSGQGGISPSAKSPNVMLFSDPSTGHQHGYYDGWDADGRFHYTGEGQTGDQRFVAGNKAVRDHSFDRRVLRMFRGSKGHVTYIGRFGLDADAPWYYDDAPQRDSDELRQVIIFRLAAIGDINRESGDDRQIHRSVDMASTDNTAVPAPSAERTVPVEQHNTERFVSNPSAEPTVAERREQPLVLEYQRHLEARGHVIVRREYHIDGWSRPLYSDLIDDTDRVLVEAKGSASRDAVRMAIGQLADYGRHEPGYERAVLLPDRPRKDLVELLRSVGISVIWKSDSGFTVERAPTSS